MEKLFAEIKAKLHEVNLRQVRQREENGFTVPKFIVHGTHVAPEKFAEIAGADEVLPAFVKETQNELDVIKGFVKAHPQIGAVLHDDLLKVLGIPPRVFGIEPKTDDKGVPLLDENNMPIPQDTSYAYALKKCSASINITDNGTPLLIGFEEKYKAFEEGDARGHIYILNGKGFEAEYGANGRVSELTLKGNAEILQHIEVSPKEAMAHNVQLVMFNDVNDLERWLDAFKEKEFKLVLEENGVKMAGLAQEIAKGHAVYINAGSRGVNPKIDVLSRAGKAFEARHRVERLQTKAEDKAAVKEKPVEPQKLASLVSKGGRTD